MYSTRSCCAARKSLGVEVREGETLLSAARDGDWTIALTVPKRAAGFWWRPTDAIPPSRGSADLMPRKGPDRVALQTHLPLPEILATGLFCNCCPKAIQARRRLARVCSIFVSLVVPRDLAAIKRWAEQEFAISPDHAWRTIAPLARAALPVGHPGLFLVGDAARVVEPFTGEGNFICAPFR